MYFSLLWNITLITRRTFAVLAVVSTLCQRSLSKICVIDPTSAVAKYVINLFARLLVTNTSKYVYVFTQTNCYGNVCTFILCFALHCYCHRFNQRKLCSDWFSHRRQSEEQRRQWFESTQCNAQYYTDTQLCTYKQAENILSHRGIVCWNVESMEKVFSFQSQMIVVGV